MRWYLQCQSAMKSQPPVAQKSNWTRCKQCWVGVFKDYRTSWQRHFSVRRKEYAQKQTRRKYSSKWLIEKLSCFRIYTQLVFNRALFRSHCDADNGHVPYSILTDKCDNLPCSIQKLFGVYSSGGWYLREAHELAELYTRHVGGHVYCTWTGELAALQAIRSYNFPIRN